MKTSDAAHNSPSIEIVPTRKILNAAEAALLVRVDCRTVARWARLGYLPAHPLGEGKRKYWRFFEDELLVWLERSSVKRKPVQSASINPAIAAHAGRTA